MQNFRGSYVNKHRDAWVEINLGHLESNVLAIKKHLKNNPKIMAVIKADGYGHGSLMSAPILKATGVEYFGVASIDEALELRLNKVKMPILVLGAVPIWAYETAIMNDVAISIYSFEHLEAAESISKRLNGKKIKAHIKIDSGMNRIGIKNDCVIDFINKVQDANYIDLKGIFTHFANVEDKDLYNSQKEVFKNIIDKIDTKDLIVHTSNSSATFYDENFNYDMVRLGIILYGLIPYADFKHPLIDEVKQIIGLKGRITNINHIKKGDGVSYNHKFIASNATRVATIPIGYADGVNRNLSGKIKASLNGHIIEQIGTITMDQMMFDIKDIEAQNGDIITLLGEDENNNFFSVDSWALHLNTINYEITCNLKVRLPRIYVR